MRLRQLTVLACSLSLLLATAGRVAAGSVTYNVTVNTASLAGTDGYLDVQFNPGGAGALAATALVTGFATDGGLQSAAPFNAISGDVTGMLPGPLSLTNSTAFNDYFEGVSFGNAITFAVTLSGPGVNGLGAAGSSFAFSLYDAAASTPLLTTDPNGSVLTINANGDGTVTVLTFPQSANDPTPAVTATPAVGVPEPSTFILTATLFPAGLVVWRRSRRP